MFAQQQSNRRRFFGLAALSLAGAWIGTRESVQLITMKPFRPSGASDLASLGKATAWLNSPPLTAAGLRGKVVLVDFWTYTCINWAAHAAVRSRVGRTVQGSRVSGDRGAYARILVRGQHRQRSTV